MKGNFIFFLSGFNFSSGRPVDVEWADVSGDWHFELQLLGKDREYCVVLKVLCVARAKQTVSDTHLCLLCEMSFWYTNERTVPGNPRMFACYGLVVANEYTKSSSVEVLTVPENKITILFRSIWQKKAVDE